MNLLPLNRRFFTQVAVTICCSPFLSLFTQPIQEIAKELAEYRRAHKSSFPLLHTDASQVCVLQHSMQAVSSTWSDDSQSAECRLRPVVYLSCCVPLVLCTSPVVYLSCCVPLVLCTSCVVVYLSCCVPLLLCTPRVVYFLCCCVPLVLCTSRVVYLPLGCRQDTCGCE